MGLNVPDRIHIMPVGYEEDRIYKTAKKLNADEVVLLQNFNDSEEGKEHFSEAKQGLEDRGYSPRVEMCDIFELYSSLGAIASLIDEYEEDEVYVNISTGSKVTAIAGMIAAMTNGATAYYVKAERYREGDVPRGIANIEQLPRYPIDAPDLQELAILSYLNETANKRVTKGDLIEFAEQEQLPFIANRDITKKGKYGLLDTHIIEPLQNDGYLTVSKDGRNRIISVTQAGKDLLQAFGFMVNSEHRIEA